MEDRLNMEIGDRDPGEVTALNLDGVRASNISGLTDEFTSLRELSLNGVNLLSLSGFPQLPSLRKLLLSDNRLSGGLEVLAGCHQLSALYLTNNRFKDVESLRPLAALTNLELLDLEENPVTEVKGYRESVFAMLPQLRFLDSADRDGNEIDEDEVGEDDEEEEEEEEGSQDEYSQGDDEEEEEEGSEGDEFGNDDSVRDAEDDEEEEEDEDEDEEGSEQGDGDSDEQDVDEDDDSEESEEQPPHKRPRMD